MKATKILAALVVAAVGGCAASGNDQANDDLGARVEHLSPSATTRAELGIHDWQISRLEELARIEGIDSRGSSVVVLEIQKHSDDEGFDVIGVSPETGFQVRDALGTITVDEMPASMTNAFESMVLDSQQAVQAEADAAQADVLVEKSVCGFCGEAGVRTTCWGVLLFCWDQNFCGDCSDAYLCGGCLGFPF